MRVLYKNLGKRLVWRKKNNMKYLFFDCETTGLEYDRHSLLTAYFGVFDQDMNLIDELDLQLKPENGDIPNMIISKEAMKVTGINLQDHLNDPQTLTYKQGHDKLKELLERNKTKGKRRHYIPCGHNISFDLDFIWSQLMEKSQWEKTVHYGKKLDTYQICTFLQEVGMLPKDLGKLTSLVEYFKIPMGQAHNAREDILMNAAVYRRIRDLMSEKKVENATLSGSSLLEIIEE